MPDTPHPVSGEPRSAEELVAWAETYGDPEDWAKRAQAAHARAERLAAANERLRGALRYYANERNWKFKKWHGPTVCDAEIDRGSKARAVLTSTPASTGKESDR